jgi:hypothetical protein
MTPPRRSQSTHSAATSIYQYLLSFPVYTVLIPTSNMLGAPTPSRSNTIDPHSLPLFGAGPIGHNRSYAGATSHTQLAPTSSMNAQHVLMETRQPLVTGTSVIGLKYKDGVMLAADNLGVFPFVHFQSMFADRVFSILWVPR